MSEYFNRMARRLPGVIEALQRFSPSERQLISRYGRLPQVKKGMAEESNVTSVFYPESIFKPINLQIPGQGRVQVSLPDIIAHEIQHDLFNILYRKRPQSINYLDQAYDLASQHAPDWSTRVGARHEAAEGRSGLEEFTSLLRGGERMPLQAGLVSLHSLPAILAGIAERINRQESH